MDRLCRNNADGAECIRAVLSVDENIDDGTEFDGNCVESRELFSLEMTRRSGVR